ncbi:unnamed protein product [Chironomus riparius]|uniref:Uncharacterized protein n=1 Tax=Chironomus riparius TaxID=315576 RepID=A0A9N9RNZ6_9DIPT|nr:unnamed protein product [Chironomus riparius]
MKILLTFLVLIACKASLSLPTATEAKGILDGIVPGGSTTTTAAPGLIPGLGLPAPVNNLANSGPMLILGGFQAIVTKFDPSLIQGLPGLAGLPQLPAGK